MSKNIKILLYRIGFSFVILYLVLTLMFIFKQNIFNIQPYNTEYNDEAFYLKQILGILENGVPSGYFGYNGSRAVIGTFGAWSPIILYIYSFFALFLSRFGNFMYITNILLIICSMFYLFQINNMNIKDMTKYSIPLFCGFGIRHIYSGMIEAFFYMAVIIFFAGFLSDRKIYKIIGYIFIVILSFIRPYLLLLLLFYINKNNYKKEFLKFLLISVFVITVFFLSSTYFQSPYFFPTYDILKFFNFKDNGRIIGLFYGLINILSSPFYQTFNILGYIKENILNSDAAACGYLLFYLTIIVNTILFIKIKNKFFLFALIILLLEYSAIIILYPFNVGFRHLYIILLSSWFITFSQCNFNWKLCLFSTITIVIFSLIYFNKANRWNVYPIGDMYKIDNIDLKKSDDNEENTVYIEYFPDLETYRVMYFLPNYLGYNLCFEDYINQSFNFNKGYLVLSNSSKNIKLFENNTVIFKNEKINIFHLSD